jgi:hypothetical protein
MAANSSVNLVGLDFDTIKTNLKTYLKNNTAFKDYNFEGSNMAMLVDLLAYNSYLNSFYLNMVASEMFLDTAQLRDSIVSHAKELNYLPRSYTSAQAIVNIAITPSSNVSSVLIPKGTSFTSRVGPSTYTFTTAENIVLNTSSNGTYTAANTKIYEGAYFADSFVYDETKTNQRFVLSNPTVDVSSVTTTVIEDSGSVINSYTRAQSLFDLTAASKIFFAQPAENNQYEIVFGDGIFGRKPKNGSVAAIEYRVSSGELPNGASTFVNDGAIDGHTNVVITTVSSAIGGSVAESIESIRFNAPRAVATQERAVTTSDYKTLLQTQFPEIQSINVYGGEDQDPPQYGKVFISVDIINADGVPNANKLVYKDYIRTKTPLTITPEFIDPEFTYVDVNSVVKYNVNISTKQPEEIKTVVQAAINEFSDTYLDDFDSTLRYSQLLKAIDAADAAIVGNETELRAIKILATPTLKIGQAENYTINFDMPLTEEFYITANRFGSNISHTIVSSTFTFNGEVCSIKDNAGTLNIVTDQGDESVVLTSIGTSNVAIGRLTLVNFNPSSVDGGAIKFYAVPASKDIFSRKNVILRILEQDINIDVERVRE